MGFYRIKRVSMQARCQSAMLVMSLSRSYLLVNSSRETRSSSVSRFVQIAERESRVCEANLAIPGE